MALRTSEKQLACVACYLCHNWFPSIVSGKVPFSTPLVRAIAFFSASITWCQCWVPCPNRLEDSFIIPAIVHSDSECYLLQPFFLNWPNWCIECANCHICSVEHGKSICARGGLWRIKCQRPDRNGKSTIGDLSGSSGGPRAGGTTARQFMVVSTQIKPPLKLVEALLCHHC